MRELTKELFNVLIGQQEIFVKKILFDQIAVILLPRPGEEFLVFAVRTGIHKSPDPGAVEAVAYRFGDIA